MFFEYFFNTWGSGKEETPVCCPFPHQNAAGAYLEHQASAHVNLTERLFHCKVCDKGYNEVSFIKAVLNCSTKHAMILNSAFKTQEDIDEWRKTITTRPIELAKTFKISEKTLITLDAVTQDNGTDITFPVFMFNHLIDIRQYNPNKRPKVLSRTGAPTGLIIPFDIWRNSNTLATTLICAGEKDMAVARSHGFNAITITGGENALPLTTKFFEHRKVVIVYDNDDAGRKGANKLAAYLKPHCESVRICTNFHEICKENKEDLTDFFVKYEKTAKDLINLIKTTPEFELTEETETYPTVTLHQAATMKTIGKPLQTNVQVVAMSEAAFAVPETILAEKLNSGSSDDKHAVMHPGEIRSWELTDSNIQDILHLIDGNFSESTIREHTLKLMRIPEKEKYIAIKNLSKIPVFKCVVTDLFETTDKNIVPMEFTAYSTRHKLESGKKYLLTYKLVPHPYSGQQLIMMVTDIKNANDSITNFKINEETKQHLQIFQNIPGTVEEKANTITESIKHFLGYDGMNQLIQTIDLSYHTVLRFNFKNFQNERGYLDTFVVSESRVGKSSTANALRNLYKLGTFTSLAGASATIAGLIGGSNKQGNSFQTRAGLIPQNHLGLLIFEEFGKSNNNVITELTDIRSSNEVRITRVSGTLTLPALVRMITLTNVKATEGVIKPIAAYPHGIAIITELIGSAEDIARYDLILILSARGAKQIDPNWEPMEPFLEEAYQTKIRWVWSRTPEQIIITQEIENYIIHTANTLNEKYHSHIKIFGTEAWKKLTRLAIAVAGYTVSTDETYENIIINEEHIDFAAQFLINLYDNPTFRLREYVENEKRLSTIDKDGIDALQEIYDKEPMILIHLEQNARTTKNTIQAATGLNNEDYNKIMNRLVRSNFVQFTKYDIIPTERFRIGTAQINRNTSVRRLGENAALSLDDI